MSSNLSISRRLPWGLPGVLARMHPSLALAERDFFSLLGMAEMLLEYRGSSHYAQMEEWLEKAKPLQNKTVRKKRLARFLYVRGFLHLFRGEPEAAKILFKESGAIYPHPKNASIDALKRLAVAP